MLEWANPRHYLQAVRKDCVETRKNLEPVIGRKKQSSDLLVVARAVDKVFEILIRVIDALPGKP